MKYLLFCLCLSLIFTKLNAQVGIGTANPDPSSILHLESSDKGFLLPKVANTSAIASPVEGLMIYDQSSTCIKVYDNGVWSDCLTSGSGGNLEGQYIKDCSANGFSGQYVNNEALSGADFSVTITNNSLASSTFNFSTSDLTLSGVAGVSVSGVSPASATLHSGDSQLITYTLSGTPTSTGTLQGDWVKTSLSCSSTQLVTNGSAAFTKQKNNVYVFSVNDTSLPLDNQGVFTSGTTLDVPYESGEGVYSSYTSPEIAIPSQYCEDGASDWTISYSYTGANFSATGNITITITTKKAGVETDWQALRVSNITTINFDAVTVPWVVNGQTYSNTVGLDEGGDAIRGSLSTSGADYDLANVDEAIVITAAEYNNMMNIVPGATRYGGTTALMNGTPTSSSHVVFPTAIMGSSLGGFPVGSYMCGVWTKSGTVDSAGEYWLFSNGTSSSSATCSNIQWKAGHLGIQTGNTNNYWAVKRPTTPSPVDNSALIIGRGIAPNLFSLSVNGLYKDAAGCITTNLSTHTSLIGIQVITSTQKSW